MPRKAAELPPDEAKRVRRAYVAWDRAKRAERRRASEFRDLARSLLDAERPQSAVARAAGIEKGTLWAFLRGGGEGP